MPSSLSSPDLSVTLRQPDLPPAFSGRSRSLPRESMTSALDMGAGPPEIEPARLLKMRRWILSLAVVNFDLDVGPVVDILYPAVGMSSVERNNIAFSSFPDSASFDTGSELHSFRIPDPVSLRLDPLKSADDTRPRSLDGFLYGYVFFHQRRDTSSKRGYLQRSIVVLTHLAYPSLFLSVLAELAPLYFSQGAPTLETACHNIANWPDPTPGVRGELGFLGAVLNVELPQGIQPQQFARTAFGAFRDEQIILASLPPLNALRSPLRLFAAFLPKLWSIWECLVLCEPLLLFASSPSEASLAIWWLRELLKPIPLSTDFRPYFHIHDQDFQLLVNKNKPRAGLLLGVTNPVFEEACKHWPHVLSLSGGGAQKDVDDKDKHSVKNGPGRQPLPDLNIHFGPAPGFHSKHQRHISKDRQLLKTVETAVTVGEKSVHPYLKHVESPPTELSAIHLLRQHFSLRASEVLVPLNRYFTSLIATTSPSSLSTAATPQSSVTTLSSSSSVAKNNHTMRPFIQSDFMTSLRTHGSPLPFRSRSKQKEFYEQWLKTPAFGLWLAERDAETRLALQDRVKQTRATTT